MKKALFLFEHLGYAAAPFTAAGWHTTIVDILNTKPNPRATVTLDWDILAQEEALIELACECEFVFGFPPCTDLAVSGAKHFAKKAKLNPNFQQEAVHLALSVDRIGNAAKVPWGFENPIGVLSTLYRKPNIKVHPYQYGGYLPVDDIHPEFPQYINARDAYSKNTCIWSGNNFQLPPKKLVKVYDIPGGINK